MEFDQLGQKANREPREQRPRRGYAARHLVFSEKTQALSLGFSLWGRSSLGRAGGF